MGDPWWVTALVALSCAWAGYWVGRVRERKRHGICVRPRINPPVRIPLNMEASAWYTEEEFKGDE